MTFDTGRRFGRAVVAPGAAEVNNLQDLAAEARELWKADQSKARSGSVGTSWGCVGIVFRQAEGGGGLTVEWGRWFAQNAARVGAINERGLLSVPWPEGAEDGVGGCIACYGDGPAGPQGDG